MHAHFVLISVQNFLSLEKKELCLLAIKAKELDWVNVLAGALTAVLISSIPNTARILRTIFRDQYKPYYGKYYLYNWSVANSLELSEKKIVISWCWSGGNPNVLLYINEHVKLTYKGKMKKEGLNPYFDLYGKKHNEELKMVYHELLEKKIDCLVGVYAAITLDSDPLSGKILISNSRMDFEHARSHLGARNIIIVDSKRNRNITDVLKGPSSFINTDIF